MFDFDKAQTYIGTKLLKAEPCTRAEYCKYREWDVPADENGEDTGMIVQYADGYVSWTPTPQFEEAYVVVPDYAAERVLNTVREQTAELVR